MKIFELIFPNNIKCINCGKEIEREKVFCKNNKNKIKIINSREKINNLNICSPYKYCDIIKNLILNFKYNNKNYLAYPLAKLLVKNYNFKNIDFITFIPLNKNKLKIRGFNQAKLLAKEWLTHKKTSYFYVGSFIILRFFPVVVWIIKL